MKILPLILSIYISILTVQPLLLELGPVVMNSIHCEEKCCTQETKENTNTCCPNSVCNPFELCAYCLGFNAITQPTYKAVIPFKQIWVVDNSFELIPGFYPDNFEPPELVA